jgi:hypothetical protein
VIFCKPSRLINLLDVLLRGGDGGRHCERHREQATCLQGCNGPSWLLFLKHAGPKRRLERKERSWCRLRVRVPDKWTRRRRSCSTSISENKLPTSSAVARLPDRPSPKVIDHPTESLDAYLPVAPDPAGPLLEQHLVERESLGQVSFEMCAFVLRQLRSALAGHHRREVDLRRTFLLAQVDVAMTGWSPLNSVSSTAMIPL